MTQYSGVYTLQQQGQALTSGQWATDPYYKNTTLLLHADGVAGGAQNNTFLDSSTNAFAITRNGNTTQGSFTPYGPDWSNYFGGSNSGLSIPSSPAFDFSGDFTIEGWVFITSKSNATLISRTTGAGVHEFWIGWDSTTLSIFYNGSNVAYPTDSFSTNQWQHYALVRSGSSVVFYINGVNSGSFTNSASWSSSSAVTVGYAGALSGYGMIGYQSNVRIVNGTAVYTSNFTPSTVPLLEVSGTSLLTCQANRFLDNTLTSAQLYYQTSASSTAAFSSTNSLGYLPASSTSKQLYDLDIGSSVTTFYASYSASFSGVTILVSADGTSWTTLYASGSSSNTTLTNGTAFRYVRWWYSGGAWSFGLSNRSITTTGTTSVQRFSPFPPQYQYTPAVIGGSGYFDGTGDYLTIPVESNAWVPSGNFTLECWYYPTSFSSQRSIFGYGSTSSTVWVLQVTTGGAPYFVWYNTSVTGYSISSSVNIALNTWNHIAVTFDGTNIKMYVNGAAAGTTAYSGTTRSIASPGIGIGAWGLSTIDPYAQGYLCDSRIVNGSVVYNAAFTPPTAPLTAIANTSLLVSYVNAGIYDNAMMDTLETVGNAQVSTSVVKYGSGSLAFDGSGDWLVSPASPNNILGTGDFTVECWLYINALPGTVAGIVDTGTSVGANRFSLVLYSSGKIYVDNNTNLLVGTRVLSVGQWYHIAAVRSSGILTLYINGVRDTSAAVATDFSNNLCRVGGTIDGYSLNGYLDDVRITKGVGRYTANFQPPKVAMPNQ